MSRTLRWPVALHELRASLGVLTILPVATAPRYRSSVLGLAPLVGGVLGAVAAGVVEVGTRLFPGMSGALIVAVVTIAVLAALTGGLHIDGLADTFDGIGRRGSASVSLAVMRQPDIGPFGVTAVVAVVLADCVALARDIVLGRGVLSVFVAVVAGRLAMTHAGIRGIPAARTDGLGAQVAGSVTRGAAWGATALALATVTSMLTFDTAATVIRLDAGLLVGCGASMLFRRHIVRRLGGITGDVLGALSELATCASLLITALR